MPKFSTKKIWVKTDGWRGYAKPAYAVAGSSDCGSLEDSPAPTAKVTAELNRVKRALHAKGIHTRHVVTPSSNVFMAKRWIIVPPEEVDKAREVIGTLDLRREFQYAHAD